MTYLLEGTICREDDVDGRASVTKDEHFVDTVHHYHHHSDLLGYVLVIWELDLILNYVFRII